MSTSEVNKCPECGEEMLLRLGMLECQDCGHQMEPPVEEPEEEEDDEGRPLVRRESWQLPANKGLNISTEESVTLRRGLDDMAADDKDRKYDDAPELGGEKIVILVLLLVMGGLNVYSAWTHTGVIKDHLALPWIGVVLIEALRLGLTLIVLYYPMIPLKWAGICTAFTGGMISLYNLVMIANAKNAFLHGLPIGLNTLMWDLNSWMQYCINIIIFIAVIGVLSRDIQKVHDR